MKQRDYIYIAGPYRATASGAKGYYLIDSHINTARMAAATLAGLRIPFFCSHMNGAHNEAFAPDVPDSFWLDMGLGFVDRSSALWLLPDWQNSRGTAAEILQAEGLGIKVFKPWELKELTAFWRGLAQ